jgi:hypothetical protein
MFWVYVLFETSHFLQALIYLKMYEALVHSGPTSTLKKDSKFFRNANTFQSDYMVLQPKRE